VKEYFIVTLLLLFTNRDKSKERKEKNDCS